jgi:hypothetical protein
VKPGDAAPARGAAGGARARRAVGGNRPLAADEAAKLASFERVAARFGGIADWRRFYEAALRRAAGLDPDGAGD